MRHAWAVIGITALLWSSCDKKTEKDDPPEEVVEQLPTEEESEVPFDFPSNGLPCNTEAASAVSRWVEEYFEWSDKVRLVDVTAVPQKPRSAPMFADPIIVEVTTEGARVVGEGGVAAPLDEVLPNALKRNQAEAKVLNKPWSAPGFALAIAPDVPWTRVVEAVALAAVKYGEGTVEFAFEYPIPTELGEPPEQLSQQLKELPAVLAAVRDADKGHDGHEGHDHDGHDHAEHDHDHHAHQPGMSQAQRRHEAHLADCQGALALEGRLEKLGPADRKKELAATLGSTWVDCKCGPDLEWWIGRHVLERSGTPLSRVAAKIDGEAESVTLAGDVPWSEAADAVLESSQPFALKTATD